MNDRYDRLRELDVPLVILIGGATGTGKSTVATQIAYRLGITRLTSTDSIRQTMRAFFSHEFMPSIHYSSFEAGAAMQDADNPLVAGFLEQSRNVLVGVRASIERALQEGWSIILEGVHIVPGLLPTYVEGALVCPFILAIEDETTHAQHFFTRGGESGQRPRRQSRHGLHAAAQAPPRRPLASYLDHFEEIRRLQRYLAERAEREAVPVIENESAEDTTETVIRLVLAAAAKYEAHV